MAAVVDESTTSLRNSSRISQMSEPPPSAEGNALTVDARYVLERRLGGGGMGVVYRALDQLMEKHHDRDPYVALKLISESLRQNEEARMMLQRECSRACCAGSPWNMSCTQTRRAWPGRAWRPRSNSYAMRLSTLMAKESFIPTSSPAICF
jgi:serine/threonine protein kinase